MVISPDTPADSECGANVSHSGIDSLTSELSGWEAQAKQPSPSAASAADTLSSGGSSARGVDTAAADDISVDTLMSFYKQHDATRATEENVQKLLSSFTIGQIIQNLQDKYGAAPDIAAFGAANNQGATTTGGAPLLTPRSALLDEFKQDDERERVRLQQDEEVESHTATLLFDMLPHANDDSNVQRMVMETAKGLSLSALRSTIEPREGNGLLALAVQHHNKALVMALLSLDQEHTLTNSQNMYGQCALHLACSGTSSGGVGMGGGGSSRDREVAYEMCELLLLQGGASVSVGDCMACTALHYSCSSGDDGLVALLLSHDSDGTSINAMDVQGIKSYTTKSWGGIFSNFPL